MKEHIDNSDYAVQIRRQWVAEQYLAGRTPTGIWKEYSTRYGLTKKSLERDITIAREELSIDIRAEFETILNNELMFLYSMRDDARGRGDDQIALRCQKQITDLLKIVQGHGNKNQIVMNTQNNNVVLPSMTLDEIKSLLGKSE